LRSCFPVGSGKLDKNLARKVVLIWGAPPQPTTTTTAPIYYSVFVKIKKINYIARTRESLKIKSNISNLVIEFSSIPV
jgi:hypothetical protein